MRNLTPYTYLKLVITTFRKNSDRAATGKNRCTYRLVKDDGTIAKCAFGILIDDSKYDPSMEGDILISGGSIGKFPIKDIIKPEAKQLSLPLLKQCQCWHDHSPNFDTDSISDIGKDEIISIIEDSVESIKLQERLINLLQ